MDKCMMSSDASVPLAQNRNNFPDRFSIDDRDFDHHLLKYVVVGDYGVGKSCLVQRFTRDDFSDSHISTIGVEFGTRTFVLDKNIIRIQIWDTAGQERFRSITQSYYRGAYGAVVVYDVTNRSSFDNIQKWMKDIDDSNVQVKLLVGNQCDLEDKKVVTYLEGKELAEQLGALFLETSAKDGTNVEQAFVSIAAEIVKQKKQESLSRDSGSKPFRLPGSMTPISRRITNCCRTN